MAAHAQDIEAQDPHFPGQPRSASTRMTIVDFIGAKADGAGGDNCRYKMCNPYHQQTNTQLFIGRMPFLLPKQPCQSTEGKRRERETFQKMS